jgi:hypothetical protein
MQRAPTLAERPSRLPPGGPRGTTHYQRPKARPDWLLTSHPSVLILTVRIKSFPFFPRQSPFHPVARIIIANPNIVYGRAQQMGQG